MSFRLISQAIVARLAAEASANPRRRQNYNLHDLSDRVQRFLNVLQPGTYVRPHRHIRDDDRNGFECFFVLQGEVGILLFDERGEIGEAIPLKAGGPNYGIELAEGQFHTLVAIAPNTVIFELKEGPYDPATDKEFLPNLPLEGAPEADAIVKVWQTYFCE